MNAEDMRALQTAADCAGLEMEFLELRANAARYEWLRERVSGHRAVSSARPATFAFPGPMSLHPIGDIMRGSVAQHLDAAIDAAMAAKG